jgi:hypothetical protein
MTGNGRSIESGAVAALPEPEVQQGIVLPLVPNCELPFSWQARVNAWDSRKSLLIASFHLSLNNLLQPCERNRPELVVVHSHVILSRE